MTIDTNDPRLTAYALNELDEADRAEVERLLGDSPDARAEVEAIRAAAARLSEALAAEPLPNQTPQHATANTPDNNGQPLRLTLEDHQQIEARALAIKLRKWIPSALAASIVLVIAAGLISQGRPNQREGTSEGSERGNPSTDSWAVIRQRNTTPKQFSATSTNELPPSPLALTEQTQGMQLRWLDARPNGNANNQQGSTTGTQQVSVPTFRGRAINLAPSGTNAGLSNKDMEQLRAIGYDSDEVEAGPRPRAGGAANAIDAARSPSRDDDADWWNHPRDGHRNLPENTGEAYARILDNPFLPALQNPLSTFSIDVDTASYSNIRRMLTANQLPPADAVRIEEMVNYFTYDIDGPTGDHPFAVHLETAGCPWDVEHRLLRVGLKGHEIEPEKRPACNLVFLIDVSGSMNCANKLPLVKQALAMLAQQLTPADRVAMVVYAGASGLALPSTPAGEKQKILDTLDNLQAGGSTNGGQGIELAYDLATRHFNKEGVNRVILCTDGDFNVGITDREKLTRLITDKAKSGVFLSVLGFGMGNLKDATLEQLADKGNGHYAYIDTFAEAKKVLVDEIGSTLVTIAKDVKIQIEFNPAQVAAYRLIGYENRILAARDFNDDKKDAGEIGAGHTVTALYEVVPAMANVQGVDALKYRKAAEASTNDARTDDDATSNEMLTVKLRYKPPTSDTSTLIEVPLVDTGAAFDGASPDLRFAASVAGFGMMLRGSPHKGDLTYERVISMAVAAMDHDANGQRSEFIDLVRKAKTLSGRE